MKTLNKVIITCVFLSVFFISAFAIPTVAKAGVADAQYYLNACTYHAYKLCQGNNIYWFSSCGGQQDIYSTCTNGLTCQYGQCVVVIQTPVKPVTPINPVNTYNPYARTACYGSSIYWFDSLGVVSGLYKNCDDNNTCTLDTCSAGQCLNTKKCDGSTCAISSADYNTYCLPAVEGVSTQVNTQNVCGNGLCEPNLGETDINCPNDCKLANTNTVPPAVQQNSVTTTSQNQPAVAAVYKTQPATGFGGFWARWYIWIIGALVLIFLFVIVFRRLSSDA